MKEAEFKLIDTIHDVMADYFGTKAFTAIQISEEEFAFEKGNIYLFAQMAHYLETKQYQALFQRLLLYFRVTLIGSEPIFLLQFIHLVDHLAKKTMLEPLEKSQYFEIKARINAFLEEEETETRAYLRKALKEIEKIEDIEDKKNAQLTLKSEPWFGFDINQQMLRRRK
ncbi:MAG TPA: hypothetical protein ENN84_10595 [Candidatus Marinimicrobia bacterium]|nr:hypothetical protein [Candidatus Neomarinimicrobiota bacterium]